MSDNLQFRYDAEYQDLANVFNLKTTEKTGAIHTPHVIIDSGVSGTGILDMFSGTPEIYVSTGAISDTTPRTIFAAATGSVHSLSSIQYYNASTGAATALVIKDGSTAIWQGYAPMSQGPASSVFVPPLQSSPSAAITLTCETTGAAVYFNAQGIRV